MIDRLSAALASNGFPFRVELRDRLVLLAPTEGPVPEALPSGWDRERILAIAREHGYTHVAIEITAGKRATLPGRYS